MRIEGIAFHQLTLRERDFLNVRQEKMLLAMNGL